MSTYRVEYPGRTVPGRGIEDGPEVEEEHGRNTTAVHAGLGVLGGFGDLDVCTNDPQADGTTDSTDQEQVTTTDAINEIQQPHEGDDSLDNTEDTGGQETSVGTSNANTLCGKKKGVSKVVTSCFCSFFHPSRAYLENGRRIVVNSIDARAILPEEEHATQEQTPHNTLVGAGSLEWLPEANADGRALLLQGLVDGTNLLNHIDVILGQLTDPAKVLDSFLATTTTEQPTGRLADEGTTDQKKTGRDQLNGERNQPLLVAGSQGLGDTILRRRD